MVLVHSTRPHADTGASLGHLHCGCCGEEQSSAAEKTVQLVLDMLSETASDKNAEGYCTRWGRRYVQSHLVKHQRIVNGEHEYMQTASSIVLHGVFCHSV